MSQPQPPTDKELEVLEQIYLRDNVRQRDLARVIGMSLGMTNAILKRLAQKGFLTVRKVNNRNIAYAVSSVGAEELARKSYRYLKRTIRHVVDYKEAIEEVVFAAAGRGYERLTLVGKSDLDFIVEHLCSKHELSFRHVQNGKAARRRGEVDELLAEVGTFVLFSENDGEIQPVDPSGPGVDLEGGSAALKAVLVEGSGP